MIDFMEDNNSSNKNITSFEHQSFNKTLGIWQCFSWTSAELITLADLYKLIRRDASRNLNSQKLKDKHKT